MVDKVKRYKEKSKAGSGLKSGVKTTATVETKGSESRIDYVGYVIKNTAMVVGIGLVLGIILSWLKIDWDWVAITIFVPICAVFVNAVLAYNYYKRLNTLLTERKGIKDNPKVMDNLNSREKVFKGAYFKLFYTILLNVVFIFLSFRVVSFNLDITLGGVKFTFINFRDVCLLAVLVQNIFVAMGIYGISQYYKSDFVFLEKHFPRTSDAKGFVNKINLASKSEQVKGKPVDITKQQGLSGVGQVNATAETQDNRKRNKKKKSKKYKL